MGAREIVTVKSEGHSELLSLLRMLLVGAQSCMCELALICHKFNFYHLLT